MENIMQYITAGNIIFFILAAATVLFGILTVTSTKILRAATYLFLTLFCIAGIYLQMAYDFLAAVQISVYAGGVVILIVFAIHMIKGLGEDKEINKGQRRIMGAVAAIVGFIVFSACIAAHFIQSGVEDAKLDMTANIETNINMQTVGTTLMGTDKFQYLLPFEASSILLLACIVGCIAIAQKSKEVKK